jgi:uracil-DNA glycosylase
MYSNHIRLEYKRKDKSKSTLPKRNDLTYTQTDNKLPYLTLEWLDTGKIHVLVVGSGAFMAILNKSKIERPIEQWEVKVLYQDPNGH